MASSAGRVVTREVAPIVQRFREVFMGRNPKNSLRFQQDISSPDAASNANLKEGPAHKLAANYYFTRDARREVHLPTTLADNCKIAGSKAIAQGEVTEGQAAPVAAQAAGAALGAKRPGKTFNYSL